MAFRAPGRALRDEAAETPDDIWPSYETLLKTLAYGFLLARPGLLDPANCAMLHLATNAAIQRARDLMRTQMPRDVPLTSQELACLKEAARGLPNKEISRKLAISVRTVRFHLDNARSKLAVATRSVTIKKARLAGLVANGWAISSSLPGCF